MSLDEDVVIAWNALAARHAKPERRNAGKQFTYPLVHFDDLRPCTRPSCIVDGVIPRNGLVAVWGEPKCGKSFWTFDLVMHIALGWSYRDLRVEQGPVVYLAFEGAEGFNARAEAFRREHKVGRGQAWFHLLASNAKLVRDHRALIVSIDGQSEAPPTVVVLDTLNRSIDGSESKDVDMGNYLAAAEAICEAFDCVVIIVHHCGVAGDRPRGHTSLTGAAASQLSVKRDAARNVVVEVEAMKDGAEGASFTSALKVVEVGKDNTGKPITSCLVVPAEVAIAAKKGPKLPAAAKLALSLLQELVADGGEPAEASNHIPAGVRVCSAVTWRETFYKTHIGDKQDTKKKAFTRAAEKLQEAHLIGVWSDKVWPTGTNGTWRDK